jgi:hypothetical protein
MPSDLRIGSGPFVPPTKPKPAENGKIVPVGTALTAMVPQNPSLAINPESGVVVIEFRNDAGKVVNSIPTAQQLAAYRRGGGTEAPSHPAPAAPGNAADTAPASGAVPQASPDTRRR